MTDKRSINIAEIKTQADTPPVLNYYDTRGEIDMGRTSARGDQIMIRCPFHDDRKPSLSINTEKGLWNCKGCDASGNVLDFVLQMELQAGRLKDGQVRNAAILLAEMAQSQQSCHRPPSELIRGL